MPPRPPSVPPVAPDLAEPSPPQAGTPDRPSDAPDAAPVVAQVDVGSGTIPGARTEVLEGPAGGAVVTYAKGERRA